MRETSASQGITFQLISIAVVLASYFTQYFFLCIFLELHNYCLSHVKCKVSAKRISALLLRSRCIVNYVTACMFEKML